MSTGYPENILRGTPRRLRAADVIDTLETALQAALTKSSRVPDVAIEFTRNAKGETQIAVKVSAPGGTPRAELDALALDALQVAEDTYTAATAKYPTAAGLVTKDGK